MKRRVLLIGLFIMIVTTMIVSAAPKVTTITYTRWAGTEEARDFQKLADLFMAKNPDIKIVCEFLPWDPYWNKLQTTIIGGSAAAKNTFSKQPVKYGVSSSGIWLIESMANGSGRCRRMVSRIHPMLRLGHGNALTIMAAPVWKRLSDWLIIIAPIQ